MAYCEDKAIPHSVFLGRVVQPGQPYWLTRDRAKVLAYRIEKAARCSRCGTAPWEWEANPHAYDPIIEQCIGCLKLEAKRSEIKAGESSKQAVLIPEKVAGVLRRLPRRRPRTARERVRT